MNAYTEVLNQADLDTLLSAIAGFHDSMAKELHLVNRAFVDRDGGMDMSHAFDLQLLVQSQWSPHGMELVFVGVRSLSVGDSGEYWGASGSVTQPVTGCPPRLIRLAFDKALEIEAEQVFWRPRPEWLGRAARLRGEVPAPAAVEALAVESDWRQCSGCSGAWQAPVDEAYSRCPDCGQLTVFRSGAGTRFATEPWPERADGQSRPPGRVTNVILTHRLARRDDVDALRALMDAAISELQKPFLSESQIASSRAIMGLDTQLIDDGTYVIVEVGGTLAGCGGWSRRATLYGGDQSPGRSAVLLDPSKDAARIRAMYTHPHHARKGVGRLILSLCEEAARSEGFKKIELMATMAGEPLYRASGYEPHDRLVDDSGGTGVPLLRMSKSL